jgi:hypothetical protein
MSAERESEHLKDLEGHADVDAEPDDDTGEEMRPEGEPVSRIEGEGEMKRVDEDVEGGEETEDISDVESGDA